MSKLRELFSIDLRSLALFRIVLSVILLADLALRLGEMEAWYTDYGLLPRAGARALNAEWSLHALSGALSYEAFLFALAAIAAIALAVGFHSRLAIVASWVLGVSLVHRNPFLQGGSGMTIKLFLFWSLWLPLGARWSIDRVRNGSPSDERRDNLLLSIAGVAILGQIILIYPMTVFEKLKPPCCWRDLSAVHKILAGDRVSTGMSRVLRSIPWAHKTMTAAALVMEGIVPFFAFSPVWTPRLRTAAAFAMMFFHAALLPSLLDIGFTFPAVMATIWTLYLPPWFWDSALPRARAWLERRVHFLGPLLSRGREAFEGVLARIPPTKRTSTPPGTSDLLITFKRLAAGVVSAFVAICFAVVVFENVLSLFQISGTRLARAQRRGQHLDSVQIWIPPKVITETASALGLAQSWGLYVHPPTDRYYSYVATLEDGSRVDLHRDGAPLDWDRVRLQASSGHWTKYEGRFAREGDSVLPFYIDYLARSWDRDHSDRRVDSIDMLMVRDNEKRDFERTLLWHREFSPQAVAELDRDWHQYPFEVGKEVTVEVVIASDLSERACKMKKSVAGLSCQPGEDAWGLESRLLPFTRVEGTPFLAPGEPLLPFASARGPATIQCKLKVVGQAQKPVVRFDSNSPWFLTVGTWVVGTLSRCSAVSAPESERERRDGNGHSR